MKATRTREQRAARIAQLEKEAAALHQELFELQLEAVREGDLKLRQEDHYGPGRVQRKG